MGLSGLGDRAARSKVAQAVVLALMLVAIASVPALAQDACHVPRQPGVVFLVDDSGSMVDSDPGELRGTATEIGIDSLPDGALAAAASFDSSARTFFRPTLLDATSRPVLKDDLFFYASGQTNYELGFDLAWEHLTAMSGADKRALIFLSDGQPTSSYSTDETIAAAGVPIYTVGFGDAPDDVLAAIAARSGGQAFAIESAGEAQAVFARIVALLTCDAVAYTETLDLAPGETRSVPFAVGPTDREYRALASWSVGDVNVRLRRPDATVLGPGSERAGETFVSGDSFAQARGIDPQVGGWSLDVTASPDNIGRVAVAIDVWKRTRADPPAAAVPQAPADGASVAAATDVTFQWQEARGATAHDLYVDDKLVAQDRAGTATVKLGAGPHTWHVMAKNPYGQTPSARRAVTATWRAPVVLVSGRDSTAGEVRPASTSTAPNCAPAGSLKKLCERLAAAGYGVFVPEIRHGSGGIVDSTGALAPNAERFADWVRRWVPGKPLLVGHSYGGLVSRKAISTHGLATRGLFTVATPHDGSWIADMVLEASGMPCAAIVRQVCQEVAKAAVAQVSEVSVDLTGPARRADRMSAPGVPVWAYAGSGIMHNVSFMFDGYVAPNDPWVGVDSAWGQHANLGRVTECEGKASHNKQLAAAHVIDAVVRAAGGPANEVCKGKQLGSAAAVSSRARRGRRKARRRPPRVRVTRLAIPLREAARRTPRSGRRGRGASVAPGALMTGPRPFALRCGRSTITAVQIAPNAYALKAPGRCRRPAIRAGRRAPVLTSSRSTRIRASAVVTQRARSRRVVVRVRGADRGWLIIGRRRIALAPAGASGLAATLPRLRHPRVVKLTAQDGDRVAQGVVPLMR